ncbi:transmembrane protein 168 [Platysternon megacephalum]|uniref:Transmembrane protein 168 n=1 Tax=Platysternon megacephalum TaxID=55544 RepID=A0A4D9EKA2_9SAUR|nr:transmembrane protein 168 [Platysternon megacephalum]
MVCSPAPLIFLAGGKGGGKGDCVTAVDVICELERWDPRMETASPPPAPSFPLLFTSSSNFICATLAGMRTLRGKNTRTTQPLQRSHVACSHAPHTHTHLLLATQTWCNRLSLFLNSHFKLEIPPPSLPKRLAPWLPTLDQGTETQSKEVKRRLTCETIPPRTKTHIKTMPL